VFGDEVAAGAIIDRLLHYSTTTNIRGESYRLKDERAGVFATPCPVASAAWVAQPGVSYRGSMKNLGIEIGGIWGISHRA
jgi:hypothetical protein